MLNTKVAPTPSRRTSRAGKSSSFSAAESQRIRSIYKQQYLVIKRVVIVLVSSLALSGCQFVPLTPGGEKARVLSAAEVQQCEKIGNIPASVKDTVLGITRQESVMAEELARLARNNAAAMGGDTVVPTSDIEQGQQTFYIYKCIPGP
jgi:hypothetical protein